MAGAWWRRVTEGRWAQNLVNRVAVPRDRRIQENLDIQNIYLRARVYNESVSTASATGSSELHHLLLEVTKQN